MNLFKRKLNATALSALPAVLVMAMLLASVLNAAFEETAVGGKPAALGGIYVSACNDVNSIYHNPAGLAFLPRAEFTAMYSRLHIGLTDNSNLGSSFIGAATPLGFKSGTFGLGWLRFELPGLYNEDTLIASYSNDGSFLGKPWARNLSLGANLKYLRLAYGEDAYTLNALDNFGNATGSRDSLFSTYGNSKGNVDMDIGLQYRLAHNYKMGLMIENLLEPNLALQSTISVPLRRVYKIGLTHTGKSYLALIDFMFKKFNDSTDWEVSPAGEKSVSDSIALRGALNLGSRELVKISCGIGYKIDSFQIDYAIVYPLSGIKGTVGDHRISIMFRFGPVIRVIDNAEDAIAKYNEERQAHLLTKKKLQEANYELEKLRRDLEEQLSRPAPVVPVTPPGVRTTQAPDAPAPVVRTPPPATVPVAAPVPVAPAMVAPVAHVVPPAVPVATPTATPVPSATVAPVPADQIEAISAQLSAPPTAVAASLITEAAAAAEYQNELNKYRKTAAQMNIPQRLSAIEDIAKKYGNSTNIAEAEQERKTLSGEQRSQEKYFRDSLEYYRNMAKYGIKKDEKVDILKRMINKYKALGIDVSEAQREIENIESK